MRMQRRSAIPQDRGEIKLHTDHERAIPRRLPEQTSNYTQISSPQAMAVYSTFSSRLENLENIIGLNHIPPPDLPSSKDFAMPLIPMTDIMARQLNLLSDADNSFLDDLTKRIRKLTLDAEHLDEQRREARKSYEELRSTIDAAAQTPGTSNSTAFHIRPQSPTLSGTTRMPGGDGDSRTLPVDPSHPLAHPDLPARISALYSTLPAIEKLAPLLPPTLERLRALREVHQEAAAAHTRLEELEEHEAEMQQDIRGWKKSLTKMETKADKLEADWTESMKMIDIWVKNLEGRIEKLNAT
jgi:nuclear migration protein JNM1